MTDTIISSASREVVIGFDRPFVIIGERINPTGRKLLAAEMKEGDYSRVQADALAQVAAGAHVLDVNAGIPLADEPAILAEAIQLVQQLKHGALHLAVTAASTATGPADGVNLIHKNDTGLMISSEAKHFTNDTSRFSNIFVNNSGCNNFEESGVNVGGKCLGKHGFARARRSV